MDTLTTNPCGNAWGTWDGVAAMAKPGGAVVAGRIKTHYTNAAWQPFRAQGLEVGAYFCPIERPDAPVSTQDTADYGGNLTTIPLWRDGKRVNYAGNHMTDMSVGSAWVTNHLISVAAAMHTGLVDFIFLDVVGARLWSKLAAWETWPQEERDAWTLGNVDYVRKLCALRDSIDPRIAIVNNNTWDRGDAVGLVGEQYVDGICLEHATFGNVNNQNLAHTFNGNIKRRRVLAIANTTADAIKFATLPGVTHVSDQTTAQYKTPNAPAIPFMSPPASVVQTQQALVAVTADRDALKATLLSISTGMQGIIDRLSGKPGESL